MGADRQLAVVYVAQRRDHHVGPAVQFAVLDFANPQTIHAGEIASQGLCVVFASPGRVSDSTGLTDRRTKTRPGSHSRGSNDPSSVTTPSLSVAVVCRGLCLGRGRCLVNVAGYFTQGGLQDRFVRYEL